MLYRSGLLVRTQTSIIHHSFTTRAISSSLLCNSSRFASSSSKNSATSSSSASSSSPSSPSKKFTDEEIKRVVKALEADPELAIRVVSNLSPAARRQLVVAGSAFEWFGGHGAAKSEVTAADADKDQVISTKDFDTWFEKALERRCSMKEGSSSNQAAFCADGEKDGSSSSTSTDTTTKKKSSLSTKLSYGALGLLALEAGLPFVGFGFLDNAVMILSGDVIDRSVGYYLGCSVLASAAMGNVISGMMGMQLHGSIERLVQLMKLPMPQLNEEQRKSRPVFIAGHLGGTLGIALGLTMGMLPLFFLSDKEQASENRAFHELDLNSDGMIALSEFRKALKDAGVEGDISDEIAVKLMARYGGKDKESLTPEQFHRLCVDLKAKGPLALNVRKLADEV